MEYKKKINKITTITLVISIASFFLSSPVRSGLCGNTDTSCGKLWGDGIGIPLFFFSVSILILLLILRWLPESVFCPWFRFAKYYLSIAAVLIILSPVTDSSIMGFDKELMSWFTAGAFFIVSLILIIYKWFRQRGIQTRRNEQ